MDVLTRREQQEQTRERLLDAASEVFARRGYHDAKLAEVARVAGFTTGAVYSNFDGKEDLFLAVADRETARRVETAEAVIATVRESRGSEDALSQTFGAALDQTPETVLLFFEFWSYFARKGEVSPEWAGWRERVREAIAAALEADAAARGRELVLPPLELASTMRAVINGLGFERAAEGESFSDDAARWAITTLLDGATKPLDTGR